MDSTTRHDTIGKTIHHLSLLEVKQRKESGNIDSYIPIHLALNCVFAIENIGYTRHIHKGIITSLTTEASSASAQTERLKQIQPVNQVLYLTILPNSSAHPAERSDPTPLNG